MSHSLAVEYVKNVLINALLCSFRELWTCFSYYLNYFCVSHTEAAGQYHTRMRFGMFNFGIEWIVLENNIKNNKCQNLSRLSACIYSVLKVVKRSGRNIWALPQNILVKSRIIILNTQTTCLWWFKSKESLHHHTAPRTQALHASVCILAELMLFFPQFCSFE